MLKDAARQLTFNVAANAAAVSVSRLSSVSLPIYRYLSKYHTEELCMTGVNLTACLDFSLSSMGGFAGNVATWDTLCSMPRMAPLCLLHPDK